MAMFPVRPAGLKVPVALIPLPDQLPPVVPVTLLLRFNGDALLHKAGGNVHVGLPNVTTWIFCVTVAWQVPVPTLYVTAIEPVRPAGLNIPAAVVPEPLQLPPVVPVIEADKLT